MAENRGIVQVNHGFRFTSKRGLHGGRTAVRRYRMHPDCAVSRVTARLTARPGQCEGLGVTEQLGHWIVLFGSCQNAEAGKVRIIRPNERRTPISGHTTPAAGADTMHGKCSPHAGPFAGNPTKQLTCTATSPPGPTPSSSPNLNHLDIQLRHSTGHSSLKVQHHLATRTLPPLNSITGHYSS
jgi:hypothetical protein